ncbi:putative structural constituent of ribosome [Cucumis melo var. makuwa]|uniref:Structural constituent of ribosome n=1 Tax=Cucumis melo var. makuwa TaxID=1194695 RepID=A0A5A7U9V1_CUCMM|nr:putative structural constituent of ribosome [Cucumis melo var. makuwa]TYK03705.1 putative structural constituent of ribosome [Cucumis melo var. makuwa]
MNRLRLSSAHQNNRIWGSQALSHGHGVEVTPMLFPSVSKHQIAHPLQQNDTESLRQLQSEGIFFPFGLPSLRFFLPDVTRASEMAAQLVLKTFLAVKILALQRHFDRAEGYLLVL